jgi:hypothetical protein
VELIEEAYTDESLKDAAKRAGPYCAQKANTRAKGTHRNETVTTLCSFSFIYLPLTLSMHNKLTLSYV